MYVPEGIKFPDRGCGGYPRRPADATRIWLRRSGLFDLLPQRLLDLREAGEALVQAVDELLHVLRRHVGVLERIPQGGGGFAELAGAFGELAGGVVEVQVRDLARLRLVQQPPRAVA